MSDESGRREVYVQSYSGSANRTGFLLNDHRFSNYQPSTDGKPSLMIRRDEGAAPQLNVILDWFGEVERSTAAGNQ